MTTVSKKKILIFIDWYVPGFKAGGPIQSCANLTAHLKDEFDFLIVTSNTDYHETEPYKEIRSDEWNTLADGVSIFYFSKANLNFFSLRKLISTVEFDSVYLNGMFSFYFSILPLLFIRNKKMIVAARGMLSPNALAIKPFRKNLFLFLEKLFCLQKKTIFAATSESEKNDIRSVFPKNHVRIAQNLPRKKVLASAPERKKEHGFARMVNIARISPEKNLLFALKILSKVKSRIDFDFFGTVNDEQYWQECKKVIDSLPANIHATFKGAIEPSEIQNELNKNHFMFMPTLGENFGHIIFESFSAACPVIISDKTIWKNIEHKKAGWEIPLGDENRYVSVIDECAAMNQSVYNEWCSGALKAAENFIDIKKAVEENRKLFL